MANDLSDGQHMRIMMAMMANALLDDQSVIIMMGVMCLMVNALPDGQRLIANDLLDAQSMLASAL